MPTSSERARRAARRRRPARAAGRATSCARRWASARDIAVASDEREADAKSLLADPRARREGRHDATADRPTATTPPPRSTPSPAASPALTSSCGTATPRRDLRRGPAAARARPAPASRVVERAHPARTVPTREAPTLSSSTPRPTSSGSVIGSEAASPQTSTGSRAPRAAARPIARDRGEHARVVRRRPAPARSGRRRASRAVRSFVPMLRKSARGRDARPRRRRRRGVSIIAPSADGAHRGAAAAPRDRVRPARR